MEQIFQQTKQQSKEKLDSQTAILELLRELIRVRFPNKSTTNLKNYLPNFPSFIFFETKKSKPSSYTKQLRGRRIKQIAHARGGWWVETDARVFKIVDSFFIYYIKLNYREEETGES